MSEQLIERMFAARRRENLRMLFGFGATPIPPDAVYLDEEPEPAEDDSEVEE